MKEVENLTSNYVFSIGACVQACETIASVSGLTRRFLCSYRALYMVNWVYRYLTTPYYRAYITWIAGTVQTGLFIDFFYYYAKRYGHSSTGARRINPPT